MVKSRKRSVVFWFPIVIGILSFFFILSAVLQYQFGYSLFNFHWDDKAQYYFTIGIATLGILMVFVSLRFNVANIYIDSEANFISFQNVLTRKISKYNFSDFDGFIDTIIKHGKGRRSYKSIGFVIGKRVVRRIDSYYYSNFDELRIALTNCNYLGEKELRFGARLRMLLNYDVLD